MAIGTMEGITEIRDIEKKAVLRSYKSHATRIGAISLANNYLITGSRD